MAWRPTATIAAISKAIDVCLRNRAAEEAFEWLQRVEDKTGPLVVPENGAEFNTH